MARLEEELQEFDRKELERAERSKPAERQAKKADEAHRLSQEFNEHQEAVMEEIRNTELPGGASFDEPTIDTRGDKARSYEEARDPYAADKHHGYKEPAKFRDIVVVNEETSEESPAKQKPKTEKDKAVDSSEAVSAEGGTDGNQGT